MERGELRLYIKNAFAMNVLNSPPVIEAVKAAEESRFLQQTLPARLLDNYLAQKRRVAAASAGAEDPHEYEMQQYFDRI